MIGFGSPTDKLRESVIVLMVSPLALRFVIDHNTKQGAEFPRFLHPCDESMQATHSRITAGRIVGDSERFKSTCLAAFLAIAGGPAGGPAYGLARPTPS